MATDEPVEESPGILERAEGNRTQYTGEYTDKVDQVQESVTRCTEYTDRLEQLEGTVSSNTELLLDLKRQVAELRTELKSMATRSETRGIAEAVKHLKNLVYKHHRWFNPDRTDEVILELFGGPIAYIEKRLNDHQRVINWARKKFDLKPTGKQG